jgi:hypothetical protein
MEEMFRAFTRRHELWSAQVAERKTLWDAIESGRDAKIPEDTSDEPAKAKFEMFIRAARGQTLVVRGRALLDVLIRGAVGLYAGWIACVKDLVLWLGRL